MKIKGEYVLQDIAGITVAVYVGDDEDQRGIIKLNNDISIFLWNEMTAGCTEAELVNKVTDNYEVDEATAAEDIAGFIRTLREASLLED